MKNRLLATTAVCGLAFFAATPAFADCGGNNTPSPSDVITCDTNNGAEMGAINGAGIDDVTVNVGAGASVNAAVTLGNNGIVTVDTGGEISDTGTAITADNGLHVTTQSGSTISTSGAVNAITAGDNAVFIIGGAITAASGSGISVDANADITTTGAINAALVGIAAGANADITVGNITITDPNGSGVRAADGTVTINGIVNAGTAVAFTGAGSNTVEIKSGGQLVGGSGGSIDAGGGDLTFIVNSGGSFSGAVQNNSGSSDKFIFVADSDSTFVSDWNGNELTGFETYEKQGAARLEITDFVANAANKRDWTVTDGALRGNLGNLGSVDLTNTSSSAEMWGQSGTYAGTITGLGDFIIKDTSTLLLTGTNTFSGTLFIEDSIVTLEDADAASAVDLIDMDNATLAFASGFNNTTFDRNIHMSSGSNTLQTDSTVTLSGAISGDANSRLVKTGTGAIVLTGTNTFTDGVDIVAGTLAAEAAGAFGSGDIRLSGGVLMALDTFTLTADTVISTASTIDVDSGADTLTLSGMMSGGAALTKTGTGTLSLTNIATNFTGNFIVEEGTLSIDDSAVLGSGDLILSGGGFKATTNNQVDNSLVVSGSTASTIDTAFGDLVFGAGAGTVSGSGDLIKTGNGVLTFSGANTMSGAITVSGGTLRLSGANALGDGSATNIVTLDGGTLHVNAANQTYAQDLVLGASNGIIQTSHDAIFTGDISGNGDLTKSGAERLTLTGTSTATGNIYIAGGSLYGTTDSLKGNIDIDTGTTLAFDQSANGAFTSNLTGSGDFLKLGTGLVTLSGSNNTLSGDIDVDAGGLAINSAFASLNSLSVNGGRLGGTGAVTTVAGTRIFNTATLAPGNSIGDFTINGALAFDSGSKFEVEYSDTAADKAIVDGNVTVASGAVLSLVGATGVTYSATTGPFTIIEATGTIDHKFDTVNNTLAFLDAQQDLVTTGSGDRLQLSFTRNDVSFASTVSPENQDVADAVNSLGAGNAVYDTFTGLTADQAKAAAQSLSGVQNAALGATISGVTAAANSAVMMRMVAVSAPLNISGPSGLSSQLQVQQSVPAQPTRTTSANGNTTSTTGGESTYYGYYLEPAAGGHVDGKFELWGQLIGGLGSNDAVGLAPGQDTRSYGFVAGMDRPFLDDGYFGVYAGYTNGNVKTDGNLGKTDIDSYQAGLYVTHPIPQGLTLSGGIGASWSDVETSRNVTVGGLNYTPRGDTSGTTINGFAEVARNVTVSDKAVVQPYAGVGVSRTHTRGYTETDGGPANLTASSETTTSTTSTLGVRSMMVLGPVSLSTNLGWQHTYGDVENESTLRFASGGTSFTTSGLPIARNAAVLGLKGETVLSGGVKAFGGYNGTLSKDASDHSFNIGLKVEF